MGTQRSIVAARGLGLFLLVLTACEKEIALDYRTVPPLYVAEVSLTPDKVSARITTTRSVQETKATYVDHATVTVYATGEDEYADTLEYRGDGVYQLTYWGMTGQEYNVDICIDGQHYTSASTLRSAPVMNSFRFVWKDVLTERMLFGDLRLQDVPNEVNYYFMHLYCNGVGYRWAVLNDRSNPGEELQQLFSCCTERDMQKGTGSDVLHEGDRLRLEVRSIDRAAYDYLYSLQLMDNTGTNPVANFTNGMLGYFSAYQSLSYETTFRVDKVENE